MVEIVHIMVNSDAIDSVSNSDEVPYAKTPVFSIVASSGYDAGLLLPDAGEPN